MIVFQNLTGIKKLLTRCFTAAILANKCQVGIKSGNHGHSGQCDRSFVATACVLCMIADLLHQSGFEIDHTGFTRSFQAYLTCSRHQDMRAIVSLWRAL